MAAKSLVNYLSLRGETVKAQVVSTVGSQILVKVTGRTQRFYRKGQLLFVPRSSLALR